MANNELLQHFRKDEYQFVEKVEDFVRRVEDTYSIVVTEFLNPRQVQILQNVVKHRGLSCFVSSDFYPTEYAHVIIAPEYYEFDKNDFELSLLEISYNSKFNQLTHRQIMGTLLNVLGIKREVIGDILISEGYAQLLVDRGMITYFLNNISKIGKAGVTLKEIELDNLIISKEKSQQIDILVSSLRLDKIIATVLKLSRNQAVQLVDAEKVKVNYQVFNKVSEILQIGDLISVRGFGRFSLIEDNGLSKNGKYKLTIDKFIHK